MSEGYLIINGTEDNTLEVDLLIESIKKIDPTRPVGVVVNDKSLKFIEADDIIVVDEINPTSLYFKSLLASPYNKTIAFLPDQLLTAFNTRIWENLRGFDAVILPKNRYSFNGNVIDPALYMTGQTEVKSFDISSIPNAIFFNKDKECDYIFGLAIILCASYSQHDYIDFFADTENSMPPFPKYIWPSWVLSFVQSITDKKILTFDFVHCIDLTKQENNYVNNNWTRRWSEFLTYWVNETGDLKIENFIQNGLVKYESSAWLTDETRTNLKYR
jgi:hypothetical protein